MRLNKELFDHKNIDHNLLNLYFTGAEEWFKSYTKYTTLKASANG